MEGCYVHVGNTYQKIVVFLGLADPSKAGGIDCVGTGFLLHYDGMGYLITARHVAKQLDHTPFVIRMNVAGRANLLEVDRITWTYHPDETVDIATMGFHLDRRSGADILYLSQDTLITSKRLAEEQIDIGEVCYTMSLFRYIYGNQVNMPIIHSGIISLMPPKDERIPVWNKHTRKIDLVEGFLIENRAIDGASGSPVLVRKSAIWSDQNLKIETGRSFVPQISEARVMLLGLFQGAWFGSPDDVTKATLRAGQQEIVPVGIGIVVPAQKIIELLENQELKKDRDEVKCKWAAQMTAIDARDDLASTDENPTHREDFSRLLDAAAKKPPQGD
jgi:hypothetical protein